VTLEEHIRSCVGVNGARPRKEGRWGRSASHDGFAIRGVPGMVNYRHHDDQGHAHVQFVMGLGLDGITYEAFMASGYLLKHVNWDLRSGCFEHPVKSTLELIVPTPLTVNGRDRATTAYDGNAFVPPRSEWPDQPYVYFHHNAHGVLIYIGVGAKRTSRAWTGERDSAAHLAGLLAGEVKVTIHKLFGTRQEALACEQDAIQQYRPCCNRAHNCSFNRDAAATCLLLRQEGRA